MRRAMTIASMTIGLFLTAPVYAETFAQVGFSPDGGNASAQKLTLLFIRSAQKSIRVLAYTFTARDIAAALADASRNGIDVRIVLDEKSSLRSAKSLKLLSDLQRAGVKIRLDNAFAIQHDKVMISDNRNIETGSFNFSWSSEHENSENAVVIWELPSLAHSYLEHWQSRWNLARAFAPDE